MTDIFQRVTSSYDLNRMRRSRVISVGCGGARSFLEDMARSGVGEFVLIDPDIVQEPNIGTQQVYMSDLGKPKVDCIAERLKQINPDARVTACQKAIGEIDDSRFASLISPMLFSGGQTDTSEDVPAPRITLLCGMTDNFYAQARSHRLSLQFGLPSLCCQLYRLGQAGEITYTYPGLTPACQRCILSPRYKAYMEMNYKNDVTSDGAPIFATTRINALCGMIALSILHHGTAHPAWGDVLSRIGNRTLVQIRMHPDTPLSIFSRVFAGADPERVFFDEAVWLAQEPDPDCPDCGGTGDLRNAKDTFTDTRVMPGLHLI